MVAPAMMGPPPGPPLGPPPLPPNVAALPPPLAGVFLALPPEVQQIVGTLPPPLLLQFLQAPPPVQVQILHAVLGQGGGPGLVGPTGQPLTSPPALPPRVDAPAPPTPLPMQGMPLPGALPTMPPLPASAPPPGDGLVGPGGPGAAMPPAQPQPTPTPTLPASTPQESQDTPKPRQRRAVPFPRLRALPKNRWGAKGPDEDAIRALADQAEGIYAERNAAIKRWHDLYNLVEDATRGDNKQANKSKGDVVFTGSYPATFADRFIGMISPDPDRLMFMAPAWADDAETRDAAQAIRNAVAYFREELVRRHAYGVSNNGKIHPSLDRLEAGLLVIEGTCPFYITLDPDDPDFPLVYEPLPTHQVYPLDSCTLRIMTMTLREARAAYPKEIGTAYPLPAKGDERAGATSEEAPIRFTCYSDELWHAIIADLPPKSDNGSTTKETVWVKKPARHDLGFRVYQYGIPALGTPLTPLADDRALHSARATRGVFAAYEGLFKFLNQLLSAVATGAFKGINPPYKIKTTDPDNPPVIDDAIGGGVILDATKSEDVEALITDLAQSPSGQALLQALLSQLGDITPPALAGRGNASSGADRFLAQQQAAALLVDPLIRAMEQHFALWARLALEAIRRKGEGKGAWIDALPIREHQPSGEGKTPVMTMVEPADIARNGTAVQVSFGRYSVAERMQLGAMLQSMVKAKFMSRMSAMAELDVPDYERENARMLAEAVYEDPEMVKASITAILEEQVNPSKTPEERAKRRAVILNRAWQQQQAKANAGQQAQEKGLPGVPNPANMGGLPAPMNQSMGGL